MRATYRKIEMLMDGKSYESEEMLKKDAIKWIRNYIKEKKKLGFSISGNIETEYIITPGNVIIRFKELTPIAPIIPRE